jgi:hypothetical protein
MQGWEFAGLAFRQVVLVAGVGATVALLLFLLRPRPPVVEVASHVLWEKVLPKRRNPLVKELLMLLLQLVAIAAIALALGEPRREANVDEAEADAEVILDRVWVVDRSLSMGAVDDDGVTRIERVADQLRSELLDLDPRVRVGVVGAARGPELLAPVGFDRQRVGLALRLLDVVGVEADLARALRLAVAQPDLRHEHGLIDLFTDDPDAAAIVADFTDEWGWQVRIRAPFEPRPNVAITAFDLRASEGIPAEEEAVVRLRNLAPWPADVLMRLETHDAVLGEARMRLSPGEEVTRRYRFRPLTPGGVEAVLREVSFDAPEGQPVDALAADDRAYAWIQPVRPVRVLLVSRGNRYLERVLVLLPGAELEKIAPKDWERRGAGRAESFDVVFLDNFVPEGRQPSRAFYVNPPAGGGPFEVVARTEAPAVTDWNHDHPLFEGLVLRDLNVLDASVLAPEPGDVRLVGSPSGALALARDTEQGRWIGWGFDFARSDLPLRLAFPQTIVNTLLWMREGRAVEPPPGGRHLLEEPLWIGLDGTAVADGIDSAVVAEAEGAPPEADAGSDESSVPAVEGGENAPIVGGLLTVTDLGRVAVALQRGDERAAGKASREVAVGDGRQPLTFPRPGLWRIAGPGWRTDLAVNLFASSESVLLDLPEHDDRPVPPPPAEEEPEPDHGPMWLWLGLGAGALLFSEFGIYTR